MCYNWCSFEKRGDPRGLCTEKRPFKATVGRQPSTNQGARPEEKPNLPKP